ncbi:HD domain-containing protein [Chitinimonas taiwanensis]|uniref:Predicted metal-dependent phosphohydrolase, HD superfamily n=1 Tax=Chitinimonas taiwanensis DSM 18899 TaxID=1121279 RepID=A0A1K2H6E5_9NEIS|nr:N-methyl-D-aspartate receptor NMDAR2C subunit [Chitinimonas taiwanensis]SFZ71105.1 Predicted metal-dependent phosphohydrolase, HD superfamily [Chitinimonas taiwanensis DSM 18899]
MIDFNAAWIATWSRLGLVASPTCFDRLMARYAEPHRHYHGLQHLDECLALFQQVAESAEHPAEVEIALWFHDAIYEPLRHDNEQRSADWAREELLTAGAAKQVVDHVYALIMATQHAAEPSGRDAQLLVDIDLAILGALPERFAEYERQVRAEYGHVPSFLFRRKRRALLKQFLARPRLYSTAGMRERFEAIARENLIATIQ